MEMVKHLLQVKPNSRPLEILLHRPLTLIFSLLFSSFGILLSIFYYLVPITPLHCPHAHETRARPTKLIISTTSLSSPSPTLISPSHPLPCDHYLHNPSQFSNQLEFIAESEEEESVELGSMTEDDGTISESSLDDVDVVRRCIDGNKAKKQGNFFQECVANRKREGKRRNKKSYSTVVGDDEEKKGGFRSLFKSKSTSPLSRPTSLHTLSPQVSPSLDHGSYQGSWADVARKEGIDWN